MILKIEEQFLKTRCTIFFHETKIIQHILRCRCKMEISVFKTMMNLITKRIFFYNCHDLFLLKYISLNYRQFFVIIGTIMLFAVSFLCSSVTVNSIEPVSV